MRGHLYLVRPRKKSGLLVVLGRLLELGVTNEIVLNPELSAGLLQACERVLIRWK